MDEQRKSRAWAASLRRKLLPAGGVAALCLGLTFGAQAQDPGRVASGMSLWHGKADCEICHGWAADGRRMDNQVPVGANLRETTLDREALIEVIKCGRPGRGMPAFDKYAYTDDRCYGMTSRDLSEAGLVLSSPAATLTNREIEAIADFLFAKVIGQPPLTRETCIEFWGEERAVCNEL